jgi:hypothetical protein
MSFSGNQIAKAYERRAEALRDISGNQRKAGLPYAGGVSWQERETADQDDDLIKTHFRSHMHDYPGRQYGTFVDPRKSQQ